MNNKKVGIDTKLGFGYTCNKCWSWFKSITGNKCGNPDCDNENN